MAATDPRSHVGHRQLVQLIFKEHVNLNVQLVAVSLHPSVSCSSGDCGRVHSATLPLDGDMICHISHIVPLIKALLACFLIDPVLLFVCFQSRHNLSAPSWVTPRVMEKLKVLKDFGFQVKPQVLLWAHWWSSQ